MTWTGSAEEKKLGRQSPVLATTVAAEVSECNILPRVRAAERHGNEMVDGPFGLRHLPAADVTLPVVTLGDLPMGESLSDRRATSKRLAATRFGSGDLDVVPVPALAFLATTRLRRFWIRRTSLSHAPLLLFPIRRVVRRIAVGYPFRVACLPRRARGSATSAPRRDFRARIVVLQSATTHWEGF